MQVKIELLCDSCEEAATALSRLAGEYMETLNATFDGDSQASEDAPSSPGSIAATARRTRRTKEQMAAEEAAKAATPGAAIVAPAASPDAPVQHIEPPATVTPAAPTAPVVSPAAPATPAAEPAKKLSEAEIAAKRATEVRPALQLVVLAGGNDEARAFLATFGAAGVSALPADRLDEFVAAAKAHADALTAAKKAA